MLASSKSLLTFNNYLQEKFGKIAVAKHSYCSTSCHTIRPGLCKNPWNLAGTSDVTMCSIGHWKNRHNRLTAAAAAAEAWTNNWLMSNARQNPNFANRVARALLDRCQIALEYFFFGPPMHTVMRPEKSGAWLLQGSAFFFGRGKVRILVSDGG